MNTTASTATSNITRESLLSAANRALANLIATTAGTPAYSTACAIAEMVADHHHQLSDAELASLAG